VSLLGKQLGSQGEDLAEAHLLKKGYIILKRGYTTKIGEIDIIAEDKETIVFIEVKTFAEKTWKNTSPAINVTNQKQKKIIRVAQQYIAELGREPWCRFDVVAVRLPETTEAAIEHFEGAFTA
jgi:putative endonuclease